MRNLQTETGRDPSLRKWRAANSPNHWVLQPRKRAVWARIFDIRVRLNLVARVVAK